MNGITSKTPVEIVLEGVVNFVSVWKCFGQIENRYMECFALIYSYFWCKVFGRFYCLSFLDVQKN